jgi:molybdenum cofactor cytidylyltransferase
MTPANAHRLAVVILAAGRSRRMGQPKMLLPWRGTSVLGHLLMTWKDLPQAQLAVVVAQGDSMLAGELDRLTFPAEHRIENPLPDEGMFSSVQCAARWGNWRAELTHWAIVLGDQPHLPGATLAAVISWSVQHPTLVCQPTFQSHRRHPVILPRAVFLTAASSGAETLRDFLADIPASYCALEDPGLGLDLDSPEDYRAAVRRYSAG